jgi:trehalose 6-phosphate phosphatase
LSAYSDHDGASHSSLAHLNRPASEGRARELLAPFQERPARSAVLLDIDGTLAPIAARAEEASVPERARALLRALSRRYAMVGCVSGRRAVDARRLVGVDSVFYVGNHGLEFLAAGAEEVETVRGLSEHEKEVRAFAEGAHTTKLRELGVRLEDKRSIFSFHWREANDERSARKALDQVADAAAKRGLVPHWGRKVLEIRPPIKADKGTALASLLDRLSVRAALYAGDDTTDLDAFRKLRELRANGRLEQAICIGVLSTEGPSELARDADLVVEGPVGLLELLAQLAP